MKLRMPSFSALAALAVPAASEDIRGIRPPLVIPPWWRVPLLAALVTLGVVVVVLAARALWRRAHRPPTPLERALAALDLAATHAREGRAHAWADVVAETLRAALAVRLGAEVLPQTTSELAAAPWARWVAEGSDRPAPTETRRLPEADAVLALLEITDLARFARAPIPAEALLGSTEHVRRLVVAFHTPRSDAGAPSSNRRTAVRA